MRISFVRWLSRTLIMRISFVRCLSSRNIFSARKVVKRMVRIWTCPEHNFCFYWVVEWSCAADVTIIQQCHKKTLTQVEVFYVESIVKADELFVNCILDHLKRIWCSSKAIKCGITNSFVLNRKNGFRRSLRYCYM